MGLRLYSPAATNYNLEVKQLCSAKFKYQRKTQLTAISYHHSCSCGNEYFSVGEGVLEECSLTAPIVYSHNQSFNFLCIILSTSLSLSNTHTHSMLAHLLESLLNTTWSLDPHITCYLGVVFYHHLKIYMTVLSLWYQRCGCRTQMVRQERKVNSRRNTCPHRPSNKWQQIPFTGWSPSLLHWIVQLGDISGKKKN